MSYENNLDSLDVNSKVNKSLSFEVTEIMSNAGISKILLRGKLLQIESKNKVLYSKLIKGKNPSVANLCEDMRNKLSEKLGYSVDDLQTIEAAISDIENQIVENKDEIFLKPTDKEQDNKNDPDSEFKIQFQKEVSILRNQFKEASNPDKEWQLSVKESYEKLEKIFKKHYPEAWIFMEFCLSIKSILNIMDFTLPFMGVLVAAPSSLKTMVIQLFRKYPSTFYTDSFTSSSLVSHNASLSEEQLKKIDMLPKMKNKLVLTPELAPLITGNEDELQKVLGIITRVLDGHGLENDTGAHGHRKYSDTMFVWLGAVVEIPPRVWKLLGSLGHKIYFLRPALKKKTVKDLERLIKSNNFSSINKEIENSLLEYLKTFDAAPEKDGIIKLENGIVKIRWKEEAEEQEQAMAIRYISQLANLLASLRGMVYVSQSKSVHHKISYKDDSDLSQSHPYPHQQPQHYQLDGQDYDTDFPTIEDASRAAVLLRNLAIGHAISKGRDFLTRDDVSIAIKVALSTAPIRRVKLLDLLLRSDNAELTTSQITTQLSVSQPIATKTMREFEALGIADISAVSSYNNSERQIKLRSEFEWFRTDEFLKLKEDFLPYDEKKDKDDTNTSTNSNIEIEPSDEYIEQENRNQSSIEINSCDHVDSCHMFIDNLPSEIQKNNDMENANINSSQQIEPKQDPILQLPSVEDNQILRKNNMPLWESNSLEHVTMSHETKEDEEANQSPFQIPSDIKESDGVKYTAFEEILRTIKERQGSCIALNYSIEIACKNNDAVRCYLDGKLTSRENRIVRDLISNIVRHPNIEVIKQKPQMLVKWSNEDTTALTNSKEAYVT